MIHKTLAAIGSLTLAFATPALAASPWDGTWKMDLKAATYDTKPDVWTLKDGVYDCPTCSPALTVPADGKVHAVKGRDYADAMSVTIVDASTVKTASYKGGKVYGEMVRQLSADGNMLTSNWRNSLNPKNEWQSGTNFAKRAGPAPAGAHAVSGSWTPVVTDATKAPENNLTATLAADDKTFAFNLANGEYYKAAFGGPPVPMVGDKVGTMIAVKRISDTVIEETSYRGGKVISVSTMTMIDPVTIDMASTDVRAGFTDHFILRKQ